MANSSVACTTHLRTSILIRESSNARHHDYTPCHMWALLPMLPLAGDLSSSVGPSDDRGRIAADSVRSCRSLIRLPHVRLWHLMLHDSYYIPRCRFKWRHSFGVLSHKLPIANLLFVLS